MQFSQTLIAKQKGFFPTGLQIETFLLFLIAQGVVPENFPIVLKIPTGKIREYSFVNPFTQKKISTEIKNHKKLENAAAISSAVNLLRDFEIQIAGVGLPKLPPLEIDFKDSYYIGITCFISSKLRSTSDLHHSNAGESATSYKRLCTEMPSEGLFTNPHTGETIKILDAGYASFWVEFELGKFLVPKFDKNSLEFLHPLIVAGAQKIFGIEFVQGFSWKE